VSERASGGGEEGEVRTYEIGEDGMYRVRDVHPVAAMRVVEVALHSSCCPHLKLLIDQLLRASGQHAQRVAA